MNSLDYILLTYEYYDYDYDDDDAMMIMMICDLCRCCNGVLVNLQIDIDYKHIVVRVR